MTKKKVPVPVVHDSWYCWTAEPAGATGDATVLLPPAEAAYVRDATTRFSRAQDIIERAVKAQGQ